MFSIVFYSENNRKQKDRYLAPVAMGIWELMMNFEYLLHRDLTVQAATTSPTRDIKCHFRAS